MTKMLIVAMMGNWKAENVSTHLRKRAGRDEMTIKDIARKCGVSVSTVSRAINGRPDVSDEMRGKILAVVEECRYIPNNSARDLVRSSSDAIGVVVRGTSNLFFSQVLRAAAQKIEARGFRMILRQIESGADEVKTGAILEREKKLQGLLFLGGRFDYTRQEMSVINVPYVCCTYTNWFGDLGEEDYSSVSIDDQSAARQAVEHLICSGHRRIAAVVAGCSDRSISELRYRGYCAALEAHGIPIDSRLVAETGSFGMAEAYRGVEELLRREEEFTAVFALSDMMAMAVIKALTDHGRRVPQDCSVIAIDGLPLSNYTIPTLTTLEQPAAQMGEKAAALLLDMVEGGGMPRHIRLEARLQPGGSVRRVIKNRE